MKLQGLIVAIAFWTALPAQVSAQRVSIHTGGGHAAMPFSGSISSFPFRHGLGRFSQFGRNGRFGLGGYSYGVPWFYGDGYQSGGQGVYVVMPPAPPAVAQFAAPAPPPETPRPEVREYKSGGEDPGPPSAFSIIGKDGTEHAAAAVWVQGDTVHYVTPDGGREQMLLAAVDRAATKNANAAKRLTLSL